MVDSGPHLLTTLCYDHFIIVGNRIHGANVIMFADDINMLITDSDIGVLQGKIKLQLS